MCNGPPYHDVCVRTHRATALDCVGAARRLFLPPAPSGRLFANALSQTQPQTLGLHNKGRASTYFRGPYWHGGLLWKAAAMSYVNDGKPKTRSRNRRPGFEFGLENVNAVVEMTSPQIKKVGAAMTMTPHSHALLAEASRFAERLGAPLTLIHTGTSQAYLHEAAKHLAISHEKNIVLESSLLKPC
jgi:hypothetical protein